MLNNATEKYQTKYFNYSRDSIIIDDYLLIE